MSKTFDADYRPTRIVAGAVLDRSYAYDAAGNLVSIADAVAPGNGETFAYDAAGRLTHATGAYGDEAYTYDAVGDRTSIARDGATDTYAYASTSQQLLGITGSTNEGYAYDGERERDHGRRPDARVRREQPPRVGAERRAAPGHATGAR